MSVDPTIEIINKLEADNSTLRAQVEELRRALEWQPIKTAPRNKTFVALLLVEGNYSQYGVGWYMPLEGWRGWYKDGNYKGPTHWLPLPPTSALNTGGGA